MYPAHLLKQHQLNNTTGNKYLLLAEKAYLLIQQKRMKEINTKTLAASIEKLAGEQEFNLYKFIESF